MNDMTRDHLTDESSKIIVNNQWLEWVKTKLVSDWKQYNTWGVFELMALLLRKWYDWVKVKYDEKEGILFTNCHHLVMAIIDPNYHIPEISRK